MRVLYIGGMNAINIKNSIEGVISKGLIRTECLRYTHELEDYLKGGETFDRLLVLDRSFIENNQIDGKRVRADVIEINRLINNYGLCSEIIYITEREDIGRIIEEETFECNSSCKIILHEGNYSLQFMVDMSTKDIDDIETNYILNSNYSPVHKVPVVVEDNDDTVTSELASEEVTNEDGTISSDEIEWSAVDWDETETNNDTDEFEELETIEDEIGFNSDELDTEYVENFRDDEDFITDDSEWDTQAVEGENLADDIEVFDVEEETNTEDEEVFNENNEVDGGKSTDEIDDKQDTQDMSQYDTMWDDDFYAKTPDVDADVDTGVVEEETKSIESEIDTPVAKETEETEETFEVVDEDTKESDTIDENETTVGDTSSIEDTNKVVNDKKVADEQKSKQKLGNLLNFGKVKETKKDSQVKDTSDDVDYESTFDTSVYDHSKTVYDMRGINKDELLNLQKILKELSYRRATYIFTGIGCTGSSTMAYCVSGEIAKLGYSVLLVDADLNNRAMSHASKDIYDMVHYRQESSSSLIKAINKPLDVEAYTNVVSPGFHMLTLGLEQDTTTIAKLLRKEVFNKFIGVVKDKYNFVVIDMPFDTLLKIGVDTGYLADRIVLTTEANTSGLIKMMLKMSNIEDENARALLFHKTRIVLNKYINGTVLLDKKVKNDMDILTKLDTMVEDLVGYEAEYKFRDLNIVGTLPYLQGLANFWMTNYAPYEDRDVSVHVLKILERVITADKYI